MPLVRQQTISSMVTNDTLLKKRSFNSAFDKVAVEKLEESFDSEEEDGDEALLNTHHGLRSISEKVLEVLLEKRTTTYKQVSDIITGQETEKLALLQSSIDHHQSLYGKLNDKKQKQQQDQNRKRIKNLRRRVYDSLNVFLACKIFSKAGKKVTINNEIFDCVPEHLKLALAEQAAAEADDANKENIKPTTAELVKQKKLSAKEQKAKDELAEANDRIRVKMQTL